VGRPVGSPLVLSLFPGIGLLDRAFEEEGFCIVRGPDVLWGGDVRRFHPPAGVFEGIIGGPPCKPFSSLAHLNRHLGRAPRHPNLIPEYERCVAEAQPRWFLMENVPAAPVPQVSGYWPARNLRINNRHIGEKQRRDRRFSFATRYDVTPHGIGLDVSPDLVIFENPQVEYAVTSSGGGIAGLKFDRGGTVRPSRTVAKALAASKRPVSELCELQGLPPDYLDDAPFHSDGKREVIANGVPLPMGRAVARAVKRAMGYALDGAA
jgi:DNA (cytosine-5)-methyltransferase 1